MNNREKIREIAKSVLSELPEQKSDLLKIDVIEQSILAALKAVLGAGPTEGMIQVALGAKVKRIHQNVQDHAENKPTLENRMAEAATEDFKAMAAEMLRDLEGE